MTSKQQRSEPVSLLHLQNTNLHDNHIFVSKLTLMVNLKLVMIEYNSTLLQQNLFNKTHY